VQRDFWGHAAARGWVASGPHDDAVEKFTLEAPVGAAKLLVTRAAPKTTLPEASALRNGCVGPV